MENLPNLEDESVKDYSVCRLGENKRMREEAESLRKCDIHFKCTDICIVMEPVKEEWEKQIISRNNSGKLQICLQKY